LVRDRGVGGSDPLAPTIFSARGGRRFAPTSLRRLAYASCVARNDREAIAWLEQSYRERAAESLVRGRDAARAFSGREIGHVMLLHIGAFETVMLPRLLDLLQQQGFTLTTLEDAQSDAACDSVPETGGTWSGTLLDMMAAARRRPPPPDEVLARLDALCR
jgi:hypothetical protein